MFEQRRGLPLEEFEPDQLRRVLDVVVPRLERYLGNESVRGLAQTEPAVLMDAARALMQRGAGDGMVSERLASLVDIYIRTGIQVHSAGSMGRQFSGVAPLVAVIDLVTAIANQPSTFYEAGPLPNIAERLMAEELNRFIGFDPAGSVMRTVSGGSLAALTALLAARNRAFPECWSEGAFASRRGLRPAVAMSEDAHYSLRRAAGILGLGLDQVILLPMNERRQVCAERVVPTLREAEKRGLEAFCLVATAGTTSVGAIDPLDALADIARDEHLWLHADGAHGASLLVSDDLRSRLKGIGRADSLVWDAHKLLFAPPVCTLLFFQERPDSYAIPHAQATYVFDDEPDVHSSLDSADDTLECTKRPMIMPLWTMWTLYGRMWFARKIEYLCRLAREAHAMVRDQPDFEAIHEPETNILCFRHVPSGLRPHDCAAFQAALRSRIVRQGTFFVSKVDLSGETALRVVFMNHKIDLDHFRALLDEIRRAGRELLAAEERDRGANQSTPSETCVA